MDEQNSRPPRDALARSVVTAAERGDRVAFAAAVQRYGTLDEAHELVRQRATLRMVDRLAGAARALPTTGVNAIVERDADSAMVERDTLFGHFTKWDTWYEVDSVFEGHFLERVAPGATKKTIRENRDTIRALFQHGQDPVAGDKPLGPVEQLREDDIGAYYEVPLLRDESGALVDYLQGIAPGLRSGLYGASFRFRAMREEYDDRAEPSDHNPHGLPERTLKEMQVSEFGPVTFPANPAATARLRLQSNAPSDENAAAPDAAPSQTERREPPKPTWPTVSQEEFDALWTHRI